MPWIQHLRQQPIHLSCLYYPSCPPVTLVLSPLSICEVYAIITVCLSGLCYPLCLSVRFVLFPLSVCQVCTISSVCLSGLYYFLCLSVRFVLSPLFVCQVCSSHLSACQVCASTLSRLCQLSDRFVLALLVCLFDTPEESMDVSFVYKRKKPSVLPILEIFLFSSFID